MQTRTPALEAPTLRGAPNLKKAPPSPLTQQSIAMKIAATVAALNQHLVSIGLLRRTAAALSDETVTADDSQPPAPRAVPLALTRAVSNSSNLEKTLTPALAFHSLNPPRNEQYLYEYISSHSSSPRQHGFRRDFIVKMQAEYRTLDTRRVPRVQLVQFSVHTERTAATQFLVH